MLGALSSMFLWQVITNTPHNGHARTGICTVDTAMHRVTQSLTDHLLLAWAALLGLACKKGSITTAESLQLPGSFYQVDLFR